MKTCSLLVVHAGELYSSGGEPPSGRREDGRNAGAVGGPLQGRALHLKDGTVAIDEDRVLEVGKTDELTKRWTGRETLDAQGGAVTPAFCDPHTHLVFAGWRSEEFAWQVTGASETDLESGIPVTVEATRAASDEALVGLARQRLDSWLRSGASLLEAKSGYALDYEGEVRLLRIAQEAAAGHPVEVVGTVLAAHAVPRAYAGRSRSYLAEVAYRATETAREDGLAEFVDIFIERGAFTVDEAEPYLELAQKSGFGLRVHAEQLTRNGGALLAARLGAASADHLEHANVEDARALASSHTVAVLLPGSVLRLEGRGAQRPPTKALIDAGVPIALGTDFNPGTSTVTSPALCLGLACRLFGMSPDAAWTAFTVNAAASLGRGREVGRLAPGYRADLCVWELPAARDVAYQLDAHRPRHVVVRGRIAVKDGATMPWPAPQPAEPPRARSNPKPESGR